MRYNKKKNLSIFIIISTISPAIAFANAGSPMMWFGMLHSLILNAIIGYSESIIISKFKIPNRTWFIILGNYISMFIGLHYIAPYFSTINGNTDFWGGQTNYGEYVLNGFLTGMISSYIVTLFIEFSFFYFAVIEKSNRRKILLPFLVANTITNIVMTIIYYWIVADGGHW